MNTMQMLLRRALIILESVKKNANANIISYEDIDTERDELAKLIEDIEEEVG